MEVLGGYVSFEDQRVVQWCNQAVLEHDRLFMWPLRLEMVVERMFVALHGSLRWVGGSGGAAEEPPEPGLEGAPSGRLLGVYLPGAKETDEGEYQFYEPKLQAAWQAVKRGFPGETLNLVSWSPDFGRLVVHAEGKSSGV